MEVCSVADPGCLSRILIFYPSRIVDLGSRIQNIRDDKKILPYPYSSHKFHKIVNYFIFEMLKKKIWASFQRILEHLSLNSQKYGFGIRDPGSEIRIS
jgi:hypothetical protein